MPDSIGHDSTLAERLRRCLLWGGYAIGLWTLFNLWTTTILWGGPFNRWFAMPALTTLHRMAMSGVLVAPAILLVGCWGFQRHRPWSRPILTGYACLWIACVWGLQLVAFIDLIADPPDGAEQFTLKQNLTYAIGQFDTSLYASLFALFILSCLQQREIRDTFACDKGGFEMRTESKEP